MIGGEHRLLQQGQEEEKREGGRYAWYKRSLMDYSDEAFAEIWIMRQSSSFLNKRMFGISFVPPP